jgi:hypothetical protein
MNATYAQLYAAVSGVLPVTTERIKLFATGIGGLGLLGWRRKRKAQAV